MQESEQGYLPCQKLQKFYELYSVQGLRCSEMRRSFYASKLILIHLSRMNSSTLTLRSSPFRIEGMTDCFYYYRVLCKFLYFNANSVDLDQTPQNCPFYGTLGLDGLMFVFNLHLTCHNIIGCD